MWFHPAALCLPLMSLPPKLRIPRTLQTLGFFLSPVHWQRWATRRLGQLFTKNDLIFGEQVSTNAPDQIKQVFTGDPNTYHAGEGNMVLAPIVGKRSVLLLDGPEHLRRRRVISPLFYAKRVLAHTATMAQVTAEVVQSWPRNRRFSLYPSMQKIALEMILRAVFGLEPGAHLDDFRHRFTVLLDRIQSPAGILLTMPWLHRDLGPLTPWAAFRREIDQVDALVYAEIRDRRTRLAANPDHPAKDTLSQLILTRDNDGSAMDDVEIHDDMMTLVIAGHESTATELCWAFAEILANPGVAERLLAELDQHAAALPHAVHDLEYLDAVVKETLRLHPVIGNLGRRIKHSVTLGDYALPAESLVSPAILLTHLRDDLYPDPNKFQPERFLGLKPDPYKYFPFGGGTRRCPGAPFAAHEMKVVLATVFAHHRLRSGDHKVPRTILRSLAFSPAGGTRVYYDGPRT